MGSESDRASTLGGLENGLRTAGDWYRWGPYLSERQWGTVREDYSADGTAWDYLPHDHARSRAYRWGEDGLAGFSDVEQRLCLSLALWNGVDPILKERIFGLTGNEGNHGEDAKEYWWYSDAVPSHAWNRWRYHYPQCAFPYADLVAENARRGKSEPEYELLDTSAFDGDRYWIVEVDYAKADPDDLLMVVRVTNAADEQATLHVLPTAWFRNTWSWGDENDRPQLRKGDGVAVEIDHPFLGSLELLAGPAPGGAEPTVLVCDNETNTERLFGHAGPSQFPKDGINDHVVTGAPTVNPEGSGTKAALWYRLTVEGGATADLRLRLRPSGSKPAPSRALGKSFSSMIERRATEADEFYAELTPAGTTADEALVMRQAFAGMLWGKQLYAYDVARWLDGDPGQPDPPPDRRSGRNARWRAFRAFDIMSMPDKWEYPWFAAWDMAFHCVALAHVDPAFAKYQLLLLCREWFQSPNGALPAYEWAFDDVNPPVQAWAALEVFAIDGARDLDFLERVFTKLLVNFTWWVNRQDADGTNLFEGGFLGLDNIGPLDRSHLPVDGRLEQSDATSWMAFYALDMATIASLLRNHGRPTEDLAVKFLEHFAQIRDAMDGQELWDDTDGFFYDRLVGPDGTITPVKVRSMVGVLPLLASTVLGEAAIERVLALGRTAAERLGRRVLEDERLRERGMLRGSVGDRRMMVGVVDIDRLQRVLQRLFDPDEFLSPHGLRALSRAHLDHPVDLEIQGVTASVDYEPAESTTSMFGGNSNWRGPIWFPLNYLVVSALERYGWFFGDEHTIEYPTGSGQQMTFGAIASDLSDRLISTFLLDQDARRPCYGWSDRFRDDPRWRDQLLFHEYFHGDNGAGLGASHQTGWTGVAADLIRRRRGASIPTVTEVLDQAIRDHDR